MQNRTGGSSILTKILKLTDKEEPNKMRIKFPYLSSLVAYY